MVWLPEESPPSGNQRKRAVPFAIRKHFALTGLIDLLNLSYVLRMSGHINSLTGWRRCLGLSLVGVMALMLWLASDVSAHRQLHALEAALDEIAGSTDSGHSPHSQDPSDEGHSCIISLFQHGKIEMPDLGFSGVPRELAAVQTSIRCPYLAWTICWTGRLPFTCGPPV